MKKNMSHYWNRTLIILYLVWFAFCAKNSVSAGRALSQDFLKNYLVEVMDEVLENPDDKQKLLKLKSIAEQIVREEKKEIEKQRLFLLEKARKMKAETDRIKTRRKIAIERWRNSANKLKRKIPNLSALENNIYLYRKFLASTPLYSGMGEIFEKENSEIKKLFFKTLKKKYPFWVSEKNRLLPRDVATVLFAYNSSRGRFETYPGANPVQCIIGEIQKTEKLESHAKKILSDMDKMRYLFLRDRYSEVEKLSGEILGLNPGNPEALFYLEISQKHLKPKKKQAFISSLPKKEIQSPRKVLRKKSRPRKKRIRKLKQPGALKPPIKPGKKKRTPAKMPLKPKEKKKAGTNVSKISPKKLQLPAPASPPPPKKIFEEPEKTPREKADELYVSAIRHYALGNLEKARKYLEKCLKIFPGHARAKKALKRVKKEIKEKE